MIELYRGILVFSCFASNLYAEIFSWKEGTNQETANRLHCTPTQHYTGATLVKHNKAGNRTVLGKVGDIEICTRLCCEEKHCDVAVLEENLMCISVACYSHESCAYGRSNTTSQIVLVARKENSNIWLTGQGALGFASDEYDQNKSTIVTKTAAVQKSSIPQIHDAEYVNEDSFIVVTKKVDKGESSMREPFQKGEAEAKSKLERENNPSSEKPSDKNRMAQLIDNKHKSMKEKSFNTKHRVKELTEHYLKIEEKGDITEFQANETSNGFQKLVHHRQKDLRHTLISPITIGAFTCMAVIAVSGFAMALIKYQRERKDMEDKQTQQP